MIDKELSKIVSKTFLKSISGQQDFTATVEELLDMLKDYQEKYSMSKKYVITNPETLIESAKKLKLKVKINNDDTYKSTINVCSKMYKKYYNVIHLDKKFNPNEDAKEFFVLIQSLIIDDKVVISIHNEKKYREMSI